MARTVIVHAQISDSKVRAVLKRAGKDERELFLTTLHRVDEGRRKKAREAMKRLRASRYCTRWHWKSPQSAYAWRRLRYPDSPRRACGR